MTLLQEKAKDIMPKFLEYAIYESMKTMRLPDGTPFPINSGKIIGIKSDAPQWAKDEYKQWKKAQEEARKMNTKL